ncbi:hypothetical protein [Rhodococcus sp. T2V]|nr:hypothetical protein [Rhodococcus sp. T2V]
MAATFFAGTGFGVILVAAVFFVGAFFAGAFFEGGFVAGGASDPALAVA